MRVFPRWLLPIAGAVLLCAPVGAQSDTTAKADGDSAESTTIYPMSKLVGLQVWSFDRKKLGKIENAVINPQTGRMAAMIIQPSVEGVSGARDVPCKHVIVKREGKECFASLQEKHLRSAPKSVDADHRPANRCLASACVGKSVIDANDESLGEIEELYVDPGHRMVAYAAIGMGGVLGLGETLHTVPYRALGTWIVGNDVKFVLAVPRQALKAMPNYPKGDLPAMDDLDWNRTTYERYAIAPYWTFKHGLVRASELPGRPVRIAGMEEPGEVAAVIATRDGKGCHVAVSCPSIKDELLVFPMKTLRPYRTADGVRLQLSGGKTAKAAKRLARDGWKKSVATLDPSAEGTATLVPADDILGHTFKNTADEKLGEIEDLLINPNDGRVQYAIAGVGGVLGIGESQHVIPWSRVMCNPNGTCTVAISEAQLKKAPIFKKADWATVNDEWLEDVDSFYERINTNP